MNDVQHESKVLDLIAADSWRMSVLRSVRSLDLPDWAVGAGFVRSCVWDWLSGHSIMTMPGDIDVLYFDRSDLSPDRETLLERRLEAIMPAAWSVTNQARMHIDNGDAPYASTHEALRHWLETPTCVAVRMHDDDTLELLAPWGTDDLFAMMVRPTPSGREKIETYRRRIAEKGWAKRWPRVKAIEQG